MGQVREGEGGGRLTGVERMDQGCYVLPICGHNGYSTFCCLLPLLLQLNCSKLGTALLSQNNMHLVYMVHSLLPASSIPEKTFWDQKSCADFN